MSNLFTLIFIVTHVKLSGKKTCNNEIFTTSVLLSQDEGLDNKGIVDCFYEERKGQVDINNNKNSRFNLSDTYTAHNQNITKKRKRRCEKMDAYYNVSSEKLTNEEVHQVISKPQYSTPETTVYFDGHTQPNATTVSQRAYVNSSNVYLDEERNTHEDNYACVEELDQDIDILEGALTQDEVDYLYNFAQDCKYDSEHVKYKQERTVLPSQNENSNFNGQLWGEDLDTMPYVVKCGIVSTKISYLGDNTQPCIEATFTKMPLLKHLLSNERVNTDSYTQTQITKKTMQEPTNCDAEKSLGQEPSYDNTLTEYVEDMGQEIDIIEGALNSNEIDYLYNYAQSCITENYFDTPLFKKEITTHEVNINNNMQECTAESNQRTDKHANSQLLSTINRTPALQTREKAVKRLKRFY